jgi:hypothetical protein
VSLKRPPSQKLQVESILAIKTIVNEMNCEYRTFDPDNAGIDGEIDLVKGGNFEGRPLKAQVKAGTSYISSERQDLVRVKVEKKYAEYWASMEIPVILLFYHPDTKAVYWKSVQDYLRLDPNILRKKSNNVIFPFDKARDLFTVDSLESLRHVAERKFKYDKIIYAEDSQEIVLSNWFPVLSLPDTIYTAPTIYRTVKDITDQIDDYYTFIVKEERIYTFSDLRNPNCKLRDYCDYSDDVLEIKQSHEIENIYYAELLNRLLATYACLNDMKIAGERFTFYLKVIDNEATARFSLKPLIKDDETSRLKIYISKTGNVIEYKHMAVRLSFLQSSSKWLLQIEPDWYFTFHGGTPKTRREIGARITKEKAGTFNKQYLYLLHAWKQYLSNSSGSIVFPSDRLPGSQTATVSTKNESFISNFTLFNDYIGPNV